MSRRMTDQGRAFLKGFAEGLRLTPYKDEGGLWTVGYGHLMHETDDHTASITTDEAAALFDTDLLFFEQEVDQLVSADLLPQEFDALVSLAYNIGVDAFGRSTTLRRINEGNKLGGALAILWWNKVDGVRSRGLLSRRAAEVLIFTDGKYDG